MAAPHRHSGQCGCSEDQKQSDAVTTSLYSLIDRDRMWCLNESEADACKRVVKPWSDRNDGRRLESDPDDGEMLLHVPFITAVHIKTITIMAWGDSLPKKVRLIVNRDDVDLSSAADVAAAQEIDLAEDPEALVDYPLKLAKFQNVSSLLIHVTESVGGEQSAIQYINLKGVSTNTKREIATFVYESRANPADHNKVADANSNSMAAQ